MLVSSKKAFYPGHPHVKGRLLNLVGLRHATVLWKRSRQKLNLFTDCTGQSLSTAPDLVHFECSFGNLILSGGGPHESLSGGAAIGRRALIGRGGGPLKPGVYRPWGLAGEQ